MGSSKYSKIYAEKFRKFRGITFSPGSSEFTVRKNSYKYSFIFRILSVPEYRSLLPDEPQYSVTFTKEKDSSGFNT